MLMHTAGTHRQSLSVPLFGVTPCDALTVGTAHRRMVIWPVIQDPSEYVPVVTEEKHKNCSVEIGCIRTEIRTWHLPNAVPYVPYACYEQAV
jgi:hypothetical protein